MPTVGTRFRLSLPAQLSARHGLWRVLSLRSTPVPRGRSWGPWPWWSLPGQQLPVTVRPCQLGSLPSCPPFLPRSLICSVMSDTPAAWPVGGLPGSGAAGLLARSGGQWPAQSQRLQGHPFISAWPMPV